MATDATRANHYILLLYDVFNTPLLMIRITFALVGVLRWDKFHSTEIRSELTAGSTDAKHADKRSVVSSRY